MFHKNGLGRGLSATIKRYMCYSTTSEHPTSCVRVTLSRRNGEHPEGLKVMTEVEFEAITKYFVPADSSEGLEIKWKITDILSILPAVAGEARWCVARRPSRGPAVQGCDRSGLAGPETLARGWGVQRGRACVERKSCPDGT